MSKQIQFYFDFMSPFSYLANTQLPAIAKRYDSELSYQIMDIPSAKIAAGNFGPSNRAVEAKFNVLLEDLERWAQFYQVPFNFPPNLDCERWNIGALYASEGQQQKYVDYAYDVIWGRGLDPQQDEFLVECAEHMGWDQQSFLQYVSGPEGRNQFGEQCVLTQRAGIFGAPIMVVDDQTFWGNDRLMFLERYLENQQ